MAQRPKGYGLTAETTKKIMGKYNPELEQQVRDWIEAILERDVFNGKSGPDEVHKVLKDGTILCELMNKVFPSANLKINKGKMPFHQMENIGNFLKACETFGCKKDDLFQTVYLYENTNMVSVIDGIVAFGRKAQVNGYEGPVLGPREAEQNVREFDEETLNQSKAHIGLQMGTNKCASQAGQNFGKTRAIID